MTSNKSNIFITILIKHCVYASIQLLPCHRDWDICFIWCTSANDRRQFYTSAKERVICVKLYRKKLFAQNDLNVSVCHPAVQKHCSHIGSTYQMSGSSDMVMHTPYNLKRLVQDYLFWHFKWYLYRKQLYMLLLCSCNNDSGDLTPFFFSSAYSYVHALMGQVHKLQWWLQGKVT